MLFAFGFYTNYPSHETMISTLEAPGRFFFFFVLSGGALLLG